MLDLFIALAGGLFLTGKCLSEKSEETKYNARFEQARQSKASLVNRKFEEELINKINSPQTRKKVIEMVREDLEYVYCDAWKSIFPNSYERAGYGGGFGTTGNILLFLMLSKSGLIPSYYQYSNISISNFPNANAYECLRILQCVEKNIQKKKTNLKLLFVPYMKIVGVGKKSERRADYSCPCSGSFHWNFETQYVEPYSIGIRNNLLVEQCKEASGGERSLRKNPYKDKYIL